MLVPCSWGGRGLVGGGGGEEVGRRGMVGEGGWGEGEGRGWWGHVSKWSV